MEDSSFFALLGREAGDESESRRYYRVSIFCSMAALEAFVNSVADGFRQGKTLPGYEVAFLSDKEFGLSKRGRFGDLGRPKFNRIEDKDDSLVTRPV